MLSESFLKSLGGLRFGSQKRRPGAYTGERRSPRKGRSVEFADYRNYTPGDDPRRVDWNIYARLERPYIKLFEEEEDLNISILLDTSASMRWNPARSEDEDPATGDYVAGEKWARAAELTLALGHVALASGDRLTVDTSNQARFGPKRGASATASLINFLQAQEARLNAHTPAPERDGNLNAWLRSFAGSARNGMVVLISDFLDEAGTNEGLTALAAKFDLNVLHTLSNEELDPMFSGDLRFVDIESKTKQDVSLDENTFVRYRERLNAWAGSIAEFTHKRGGRYVMINTSTPTEETVMHTLRREGWLV